MNKFEIKRFAFVLLLILMVVLLAAGFLLKSDGLNTPSKGALFNGGSPELEPLDQPSPDGKYIVGVSAADPGMSGSQITLAREGAKDWQVIADGDENSWVTNPIWSPDGATVAYLRVVNVQSGEYEIDSRYELWVYDVATDESRLITDADTLNPTISFDGNADIMWVSDTKIRYADNAAFPTVYYTVDIHTFETTSDVSLPQGGISAQPGEVTYFSQCNSTWGGKILGTCSEYTICEQGCAISSAAMVINYFGVNTDPGKMNDWLKANGGYFSGCLINWATAASLAPNQITWVARVDGEDWTRLRYELDSGYPVIVEVPVSSGQHFVVATGYSGDTVFIHDPYYTSRTTLDSYGNHFKGLRIYHGPTAEPATCPAPTDSQVYMCQPVLTPEYKDNTCSSLWYPVKGYSGNANFLVENAATTETSTNQGAWMPNLPSAGKYQVEAFISAHGTFSKVCSSGTLTFGADSSKAKYVVTGKDGAKTEVVRDQLPMNDEWLNLGEFYFDAGMNGYITLTDVTGELESARNLSFGAMRFTLVGPDEAPPPTVGLLSPGLTAVGAQDFALTLTGGGFTPESIVRWNGSDLATTFISETQLNAIVSAANLAAPAVVNVSVFNPVGDGIESNALAFPIIDLTPARGEALGASKVTFDWEDIAGATQYALELSLDSEFATELFSTETTDSTYFYDAYLDYDTPHYWRIKYQTGDMWSEWSTPFSFTSMSKLAAPSHSLRLNETNITFTWQPVPNAASYTIEIARDAAFIFKVKNENVEENSVTFKLPIGRYYWRVRALDAYGVQGPWSLLRIMNFRPF